MGGMGGMDGFSSPFDIFESFFQGQGFGGMGARSRNRPMPGEDERYDLQLDFLEAVFGTRCVSDSGILQPACHARTKHIACY